MIAREKFLVANGLRHHVLEWGAGPKPTLVLLHGFLDIAWSFDAVARALAVDRRVVAFDFRGHGETEWVGAGGYYHFPDYVLDLEALLEALGEEAPIDLLGHSMGGSVATLFGGARPLRLRSLVLVEGLGPPEHAPDQLLARTRSFLDGVHKTRDAARAPRPMRDVAEALGRMRRQNPDLPEELGLFLAEKSTRPAPDGTGLAWRFDPLHRTTSPAIYRTDQIAPFFAALPVPVLYVAGERGYRLGDEAERLALFPRAPRTVEVAGAGHMLHWTHAKALADAVSGFLSTVDSSTMPAEVTG